MLQLFPTITILVMVLNACEECLEQVRYIGFLLHNIEKDVEDQRINTLTENFSLQILHEPLMFSVSGFFKMDFMFLKTIIASITSKLVLFFSLETLKTFMHLWLQPIWSFSYSSCPKKRLRATAQR